LQTYFTTVKVLRDYMSEILVSEDDQVFSPTTDGDSQAYLDLLNSSYVALKPYQATQRRPQFRSYPAEMYMAEVGAQT